MQNDTLKIALAIGFFDCMHLGHRALISKVREIADERGYTPAAFTFTADLRKNGAKQLYTFTERKILFRDCGIENIVAYPFDESVRSLAPKEFLTELISRVPVAHFVCGTDYSFGKDGAGRADDLAEFCDSHKIGCTILKKVLSGGEAVSTSRVRKLLDLGAPDEAAGLLGVPFFIEGEVVRGRGEGHTFGIPTANLSVPEDKFLPKFGVYGTRVTVDGATYRGVTNVGAKPTFSDPLPSVETLLSGFEGDLYGKTARVSFVKYLRDIKKFESPFALAEQIRADLLWE